MKTKDIVCGMEIEMESSEKFDYQGKSYYFCSTECKELFAGNPAKYLKEELRSNRACKE